jgi:hypothetical protein
MPSLNGLRKQVAELQRCLQERRERDSVVIPEDPIERARWMRDEIAHDAAETFGADDPRADRKCIDAMSISELGRLFEEIVLATPMTAQEKEEQRAFEQLPFNEQVHRLIELGQQT